MKLHVYNGPLPLLPPYFELRDSSSQADAKLDLNDLLARLLEEERLKRARVRGVCGAGSVRC